MMSGLGGLRPSGPGGRMGYLIQADPPRPYLHRCYVGVIRVWSVGVSLG